jgi:hypothetical protein
MLLNKHGAIRHPFGLAYRITAAFAPTEERVVIMHRKGINYDTGITPFGNRLSRESFDPGQVRREMEIIVRDLHCTAVRISGRDPHRIALAAEYALGEGLEVWFAPFPCNMTADELVLSFVESAQVAKTLRRQFAHVVFVLGCEMSLFNTGFIPGAQYLERFQTLMNPALLANVSAPRGVGAAFQCLSRAGCCCGARSFSRSGDLCLGNMGKRQLELLRSCRSRPVSGC